MTNVTVYPNVFGRDELNDPLQKTTSLERIAGYIREGRNGLDDRTVTANRLARGDKEVFRKHKNSMPTAVFAGTFEAIPATNESLIEHSGFVVMDYDGIEDVASAKAALVQVPEVKLAFISPSAKGVKAVLAVTPNPTNEDEHRAAWNACAEHLDSLDGLNEADDGKDLSRKCFLAHDPTVHFRDDGPTVSWEMEAEEEEAPTAEPTPRKNTGTLDIDVLKYLDVDDYDVWLKVGMALHYEKQPIDVWEEWSQQSEKYEKGSCEKKWKSFKSDKKAKPATWDSLVKLAKAEGYESVYDRYFSARGRFMPGVLQEDLTTEHGMHFVRIPTEHYTRIYDDGVYVPDTGQRIEKKVMSMLGRELVTPSRLSNVSSLIETDSLIPMPAKGMQPCHHPNALNVQNGILDLKTMELTPHTHDEVWIHQLPVNYNPDAKCPTFDGWLHDIQEGRFQDIDLAHEILGVSLLQRVLLPQIYFLHGATHTGKSTFLDVMTALLGEENISDVEFTELGSRDDKFATASLVGKLANIDRDVTIAKLTDTGAVKKIAGGELISVQEKNKPRFSLRPYATIIMATNDMPRSIDWSDGWTSRLCILSFQKSHLHKPKRDMVERMTTEEELSGILNHALEGLQRVIEKGQHTDSETVSANRRAYEEHNNMIVSWFNENFVRDDGRLLASDVEAHYAEWCENEGVKPLAKATLRSTLHRMGIPRKRIADESGSRPFAYEPIRFRENSDDTPIHESTADSVGF